MAVGDAFPSTQHTFLGRLLDEGRRGAAAEHIMALYARPLEVYLRGSSFRGIGEPADVVHGFFADRLARAEFLAGWLESRRQLRYWLITAFRHYLFERIRGERKSASAIVDAGALAAAAGAPPEAEAVFHREAALTLVREALRLAEDSCRGEGLHDHWRVFVRHHLDGRSYDQLAPEFNLDPARFRVMNRTAANRVRSALRQLVAWTGASERDVDGEIHSLMEAIRP